MITDTEGLARSILGGIITQNTANYLIEKGLMYSIRIVKTIPAGLSNIIFDSSAIPIYPLPGSKFVVIQPPSFTAVGGDQVIISLFNGSTYTLGTIESAVNRDEESGANNDSFIVSFPATVPVAGVDTGIKFLIPSAAQGNVTAGGTASSPFPFVSIPGIKRFEINNTGLTAQYLELVFTWVEIPRS